MTRDASTSANQTSATGATGVSGNAGACGITRRSFARTLPATAAALLGTVALGGCGVRISLNGNSGSENGAGGFSSSGSAGSSGGSSGGSSAGSQERVTRHAFEPDEVRSLGIEWAAGAVDVVMSETAAQIEIVETAWPGMFGNMPPELVCTLSNGHLRVAYGNASFQLFSSGGKDLAVTLPASMAGALRSVSLDAASGSFSVDGVACDSLDVELASGQLDARGIDVGDLEIDVASGTARATGRVAGMLDAEMASGSVTVTCQEVCPVRVDANIASGTMTLALPGDPGFTARIDKASGSFSCEFETLVQGKDIYVHGDGTLPISADIASGRLAIQRA